MIFAFYPMMWGAQPEVNIYGIVRIIVGKVYARARIFRAGPQVQ